MERNGKCIEVVNDDRMLRAYVGIDNFVDISASVLARDFLKYGIVLKFGIIEYKVNLITDGNKYGIDFDKVEIDWEQLVYLIRKGLHSILNEEYWNEEYWQVKKEQDQKSIIRDVVSYLTSCDDYVFIPVVRLNLDNFIWHTIHNNYGVLREKGTNNKNKKDRV